jgi:hypothetical protein
LILISESVFNGNTEFNANVYDNKENHMEEPTTNGDPFNMGKYTCKHVK